MSKTITMSFFPLEGNRVKAFASMIHRLLPDSRIHKIRRHKQSYQYKSEQMELHSLISTIEAPESELLFNSNDSFSVQLEYNLASGESIPLDLNFHGIGYEMGHRVRNDSCIEISAQDISLWSAIKKNNTDMYDTNSDISEYLKIAAVEKVNLDMELLFLKACGFSLKKGAESLEWETDKKAYIEHAAVYYESGWLCPLNCQMVYHKDPQEFAKDFERIYADYHWGITMPLLYALGKNIWQLSKSEIASLNKYKGFARRCGKEYPGNYKYFSRPQEFTPELTELDSINFVESLDKNKVQQLSKIPINEIKEILLAIAESELPEIRCRDFDDQGIVLLTGFNLSIWRAYLYLAELSSPTAK